MGVKKGKGRSVLPTQDVKAETANPVTRPPTLSSTLEPRIPRSPSFRVYLFQTTLTVSRLAPSNTTMSLRPPLLLPAPSRGLLGAAASQSCSGSRSSRGWNPPLGAAIFTASPEVVLTSETRPSRSSESRTSFRLPF